jgi:hypothetical protein
MKKLEAFSGSPEGEQMMSRAEARDFITFP